MSSHPTHAGILAAPLCFVSSIFTQADGCHLGVHSDFMFLVQHKLLLLPGLVASAAGCLSRNVLQSFCCSFLLIAMSVSAGVERVALKGTSSTANPAKSVTAPQCFPYRYPCEQSQQAHGLCQPFQGLRAEHSLQNGCSKALARSLSDPHPAPPFQRSNKHLNACGNSIPGLHSFFSQRLGRARTSSQDQIATWGLAGVSAVVMQGAFLLSHSRDEGCKTWPFWNFEDWEGSQWHQGEWGDMFNWHGHCCKQLNTAGSSLEKSHFHR